MTRAARILLVDDEVSIQRAVGPLLQSRGYEVEIAGTGRDALRIATERRPELIVLDLGLPDIEGTEVCRLIRSESTVPIIVLSARGAEADKVSALDLGADDYVTKPFDLEELIARIHAVLRRASPELEGLALGDVLIDFTSRSATRDGSSLHLTDLEFDLLWYLAERCGRIVSRGELLRAVWRYSDTPVTRSVDNIVARLRRKIEPGDGEPRYIHTVRGQGYLLTPDGQPPAST